MPKYVATVEVTLDTAQYRAQDRQEFPDDAAFVRHMAGVLTEDLRSDSDGVVVVGVRRRGLGHRKAAAEDPQVSLRSALAKLHEAWLDVRQARQSEIYDAGERPYLDRVIDRLEAEIDEMKGMVAHYDLPPDQRP